MNGVRRIVTVLVAVVVLVTGYVQLAVAVTTWDIGDVFVAIGNGKYKVYSNAGVYKETIDDGTGGVFTAGCAFNPSLSQLNTTNFTNNKVFFWSDATHTVTNPGGLTTTNQDNESVIFAGNGDFFVGHADGDHKIDRYSPTGTFLSSYSPATEVRGTDWIELASNQTTIYYTSEGFLVKRFDITGGQLADFATLPNDGAFALRLLPPGDGSAGLLVANELSIERVNASGVHVQSYGVGLQTNWFALNLDPNGTSFWSADYSGNFYRFNIASGAVEVGPINTGTGGAFGVCVKGEPTAATQHGVFVIGNVEPHGLNQLVDFWGSQWWANNAVTGTVSNGVASFKGWASNSDSVCGGTWTSRPGNSSDPPPSLSDPITVVVTDSVVKDGPNISGNVIQVLEVHPNPGYGPSPGHRGYGTVTKIVCPP